MLEGGEQAEPVLPVVHGQAGGAADDLDAGPRRIALGRRAQRPGRAIERAAQDLGPAGLQRDQAGRVGRDRERPGGHCGTSRPMAVARTDAARATSASTASSGGMEASHSIKVGNGPPRRQA